MNKQQLFNSKEQFKNAFSEKFIELEGKDLVDSNSLSQYKTLVTLIRDRLNRSWKNTTDAQKNAEIKQVYYFSMEFLIGKLLNYYLVNLDLEDVVRAGLKDMDIDLDRLLEQESDPGLGNGGLGRLAACFLDSMANVGLYGNGNGMRYKFGLFNQKIIDGYQVEVPDNWLKHEYQWEKRRSDKSVLVKFKGDVSYKQEDGKWKFELENYEPILAVPYDIPIVSNSTDNIGTLRLWSAEPVSDDLDMFSFNTGDFARAMAYRSSVEAISYILYPEDSSFSGRELRLKQEYLIVCAGIKSIIRRLKKNRHSIHDLNKYVCIHINDTHPAVSVAELMRVLIDEEGLNWEEAWAITRQTISYTNHTILPEALEKWPTDLMRYLLPRVNLIIEEIDRRYREGLAADGVDEALINSTAIVKDGYVHMANLAVIGSYSVNGVASLHTDILKELVLKDFYALTPEKFNNKTNGISHRRFLRASNKSLSTIITDTIGDGWIKDLMELKKLEPFAKDKALHKKLNASKVENKQKLAAYIKKNLGIEVDPNSIFDIQVKRLHAYKRQLLNAFKVISLYNDLKENPKLDIPPCTFIFAGKAAPGYYYAKCVIKLINSIADKVNNDPDIGGKIKVVFLPNFNVTLGEKIYPAANISEQISTASQEASGTGNMKFMMNGAITLGTMDGANVEIFENVGEKNIKIFGLSSDQVIHYQHNGGYNAYDVYMANPKLKRIVDSLVDGTFSTNTEEFREIYDSLIQFNDQYFVLQDFQGYMDAFFEICKVFEDKDKWAEMSLMNIANSGVFSSDRSIREYAADIWNIK